MSDKYKTAEQCSADLDAALDKLVFKGNNSFQAKTCFCCDSLLLYVEENPYAFSFKSLQKCAHLFRLGTAAFHMSDHMCVTIPDDVIFYYKYKIEGDYNWLQNCIISPNSCYDKKKKSFLVCKKCYNSLRKKRYPILGIKNGYMIGTAPDVVNHLSPEEMSCISLVRNTAHIFTYMGGEATELKGWHSMNEVDVRQVQRTLRGMDHKTLGFPDSITIVLSGPMTDAQYMKAKRKTNVSRKKMLQALAWFIENNCYYAKQFESIPTMEEIPMPQVIDNVHIVDSVDTNFELTEQMSMVFPDDTLDETTGGFDSVEDFKKIISDINRGNTSVTVTSRASKYVYANCDNNFVKAFPQQFPYGVGGPNQMRLDANGEMAKVDFTKYIQHINNLSNLNFHTQHFSVLTWNVLEKQEMMNRACLRIKPNAALQKKIVEADGDKMEEYISTIKQDKIPDGGNSSERMLLDTVNSITYALPHSNEHAKENRRKAFSMQLRFGFPFVFFTVAPDDTTSYTVSVYSGLVFDPSDKLEDLTNKDLIERATKWQQVRIKYAGIGALWYGAVMDAIWKHVIGWDWARKQGSPGLYGIPEATTQATEEQTRKRLHAHCLVWIQDSQQLVQDLQSSDADKRLHAKNAIADIFDRSTSTKLIDKETLPKSIFEHTKPCTNKRERSRKKPCCVDPQQLREMRHKIGKDVHKGVIGECPDCHYKYTLDELVIACLKYWNATFTSHDFNIKCWSPTGTCDICNLDDDILHVTGKKKLEELLFILSTPISDRYPEISEIITNAVRNLHGDNHAFQCFKNGDECRYKLPALHCIATIVECIDTFQDWYDYLGNKTSYDIHEILAKRSEYDVFQNQASIAISQSKLGSNSNSQLCLNALKAMYITKYPTKNTQKEDQSEYENVVHYSSLRLADRRFEHDCTEALSRAIGACIAHNASNVISAWLAKHLINHRSRFRFSHDFRNIPHPSVQDELLRGESRWRQVKNYKGQLYIDSPALQYLHRPATLENLSLVDFFLHYHVARKSKDNQKNMICYHSDESYEAAQYQGILRSKNKREYLPDITVWRFPDAATFGGLLLDSNSDTSPKMEEYAFETLICFCPFQKLEDLMLDLSFLAKFRQWYHTLQSDKDKFSYIHRLLTNMQQLKNSLRIRRKDDVLCDGTHPFIDPTQPLQSTQTKQYSDRDKARYDEQSLHFIEFLVQQQHNDTSSHTFTDNCHFLLSTLQNKGTWNCGFKNIASMDKLGTSFPIYTDDNPFGGTSDSSRTDDEFPIFLQLRKSNLVEVMLQRTIRQHSTLGTSSQQNTGNENYITTSSGDQLDLNLVIIEANGTPESIHLWGKQVFPNDKEQQRAFEILAAKFVLTFCTQADDSDSIDNILSGTGRQEYLRCKRLLNDLVGKPAATGQLIMFLSGPGGSGKSEVINQLLLYGQQYCANIQQPFTRNTILVTAYSGVAATLIHGQTLHSATYLNKSIKNIDPDDKAMFQNNVKMLIVDEISMLSSSEMKTLSARLNWLTDNRTKVFGGIDVAFMGDFRQLTPVGKKTIYEAKCVEFRSYVNCYIALKGQHRFQEDPEFGMICSRFHDGCPTIDDFIAINSRVVSPTNPLPNNVRTGCKRNDEREAVNVGTWLQYLKDHGSDQGCVILADNVEIRTEGAPNKKLQDLMTFYTQVGEDDCETHMEGRFAPMLRCYPMCPQMLTINADVGNNLANGTQGLCAGIVLQPQQSFHLRHIDDMVVKCVYASQIKHVLWEVNKNIVFIEPKQYNCLKANFPLPPTLQEGKVKHVTIHLKATQIPLISNNATTGHKLQGSSLDALYVPAWNYATNWPYVVISRVRFLEGLFLGKELDPFKDYSVPQSLALMLNNFAIHVSPSDVNYLELNI